MALKPRDKFLLVMTVAFIAFCMHMLLHNAGVGTYTERPGRTTDWTDFLHLVIMSATTLGFGDPPIPVNNAARSVTWFHSLTSMFILLTM